MLKCAWHSSHLFIFLESRLADRCLVCWSILPRSWDLLLKFSVIVSLVTLWSFRNILYCHLASGGLPQNFQEDLQDTGELMFILHIYGLSYCVFWSKPHFHYFNWDKAALHVYYVDVKSVGLSVITNQVFLWDNFIKSQGYQTWCETHEGKGLGWALTMITLTYFKDDGICRLVAACMLSHHLSLKVF